MEDKPDLQRINENKKIYEKLLDNSIHSMLSAIEIYNKPDFKYREEVFVILLINSWELFLKSKLLKENDDNLEKIYVFDKEEKPKKSRTGANMTIEIKGAIERLKLEEPIKENLNCLIEIRDTAVHFYNDESIGYLVYSLSAASIKNYEKLMNEWFGKSLTNYNFYILPLGFNYNFQTITPLNLKAKSEQIQNILTDVSKIKNKVDESKGFYFTCEISAKVVSAKKIVDEADIIVSLDPNAKTDTIILQKVNLIDLYPLTYRDIYHKVKEILPGIKIKQKRFNEIIQNLKGNKKYSANNFSSKKKRELFETKGILKGAQILYNQDALLFIVEELKK